jgi:hypothetical protein
MPNKIIHIYVSDEEEAAIRAASVELQTSVASIVRGAVRHLTNGLTDFSSAREWIDFRSRGRPRSPSTGSEINDAARDIYRHTIPQGEVDGFQSKVAELTAGGMGLDEAIEAALVP